MLFCMSRPADLTNDGTMNTVFTSSLCQMRLLRATLPLLAEFWWSSLTPLAPVLAPSGASAAPSAPVGSSLYKYQSAPAAREWTSEMPPRCHSSAGRQKERG